MEIVFKNQLLLDLFLGDQTYNKLFWTNPILIRKFQKTIVKLKAVDNIYLLSKNNGLNYEKLKGKLSGYSSVRIDKKYRLIIKEVYDQIIPTKVNCLEIIEITNHYS